MDFRTQVGESLDKATQGNDEKARCAVSEYQDEILLRVNDGDGSALEIELMAGDPAPLLSVVEKMSEGSSCSSICLTREIRRALLTHLLEAEAAGEVDRYKHSGWPDLSLQVGEAICHPEGIEHTTVLRLYNETIEIFDDHLEDTILCLAAALAEKRKREGEND